MIEIVYMVLAFALGLLIGGWVAWETRGRTRRRSAYVEEKYGRH